MPADKSAKDDLRKLMADIAARCKLAVIPDDWEFELYRLIEVGFHTFFKFRRPGMVREDMTALQRAGAKAGGWLGRKKFYPIEDWKLAYETWKAKEGKN